MLPILLAVTLARAPISPGHDWITCGWDCLLFGAADVNGDGLDDVLTINGGGDLCAAFSVKGMKASPWEALHSGLPFVGVGLVGARGAGAGDDVWLIFEREALVLSRYENDRLQDLTRIAAPEGVAWTSVRAGDGPMAIDDQGRGWRFRAGQAERAEMTPAPTESALVSPPPLEPDAPVMASYTGDLTGDGVADAIQVFSASIPHQHRAVRYAPGPRAGDADDDGLADELEARIGTDRANRDTDGDGLLDGWEVNGLPCGVSPGDRFGVFEPDAPASERDGRLDPRRQDVICKLSYFEGVDPAQMDGELPRIQQVYRRLASANPDGSTGLWVHVRIDPEPITKDLHALPWWTLGEMRLTPEERGIVHWMQITPWGGGQSSQTGDMGGAGNGWAVFSHEFGHQLSLGHAGDSEPAWCPLYPSLMNYAFGYSLGGDANAIRFSDGRFRGHELRESALVERLPFAHDEVKYLEAWPFRFTLKPDGDGTLIDWNQNGVFDAGPVEADINYGGSTHGGIRRDHEPIGSAPCLAYVGGTCLLAAADRTRDHLWVKSYLGDEQWSEKRVITNSGTAMDPVLVGGPEFGLVLHHHLYGWRVTRVTPDAVGTPTPVPDLAGPDLNACRVGERVLIVQRRDDHSLSYRWLTFTENDPARPVVSAPRELETRSMVTPGLAADPGDGRIVLATSMHNSRGGIFAMRVTWLSVQGDRLWEQETAWTRGEGSGNGCCSRPVVAFAPGGQLTIFHQGGPDDTGQMIAYRTTRISNTALDEGWLTCMMYDVWTRSRVPVGFASGAQGAIYAYRWDAGGDKINGLQTAHAGFGIDAAPMRDFDDAAQISRWGIRHSILTMRRR